MPHYSQRSDDELDTATYNLQQLFGTVIKYYDNTIIQGWRPISEQAKLYEAGLSRVKFSKHNESPSQAIDSAPYLPGRGIPWPKVPMDWNDRESRDRYIKDMCQWYHYIGFVIGISKMMNIEIRSGADWDRDHNISDQSWSDLVHFEEIIKSSIREV